MRVVSPPRGDVDYEVEEVRMSTGAGTSLEAPAFHPSSGEPLYGCTVVEGRHWSLDGDYDHPCKEFDDDNPGSGPSCLAYVHPGPNPDTSGDPPYWGSCILKLDAPHDALTVERVPLRFMVVQETPAFFFSYPELVDYTFAMGYEKFPDSETPFFSKPLPSDNAINDVRTRRVVALFEEAYRSDEALV